MSMFQNAIGPVFPRVDGRMTITLHYYYATLLGGFLCRKDRAVILSFLAWLAGPFVRVYHAWKADREERRRVDAYRAALMNGYGSDPAYSTPMPTLLDDRDVIPFRPPTSVIDVPNGCVDDFIMTDEVQGEVWMVYARLALRLSGIMDDLPELLDDEEVLIRSADLVIESVDTQDEPLVMSEPQQARKPIKKAKGKKKADNMVGEYRSLQQACKDAGIPARGTTEQLRQRLSRHHLKQRSA